jgi:hypothetical protein
MRLLITSGTLASKSLKLVNSLIEVSLELFIFHLEILLTAITQRAFDSRCNVPSQ